MSEAARGIAYWRSARAVRERAEEIFERAVADDLAHFEVRLDALPSLASRVVDISRDAYPDLRLVPVHGRYRHFDGGRLARLDARLAGSSTEEKLCARADLVIASVLLDAGAGASWRYHDPESGRAVGRSEGLALASFDWFANGGLSASPEDPLRIDASRLAAIDPATLSAAFQVTSENPLVGLGGRVTLLARLASALQEGSAYFDADRPRPGHLAVQLARRARQGELPAHAILEAVLDALGGIWPGRETQGGVPLGDTWNHSRFGRIPFHKLSQWLTYSLFEPLEQAGIRITRQDELTGLAEYRNGGLFIDGGVLAAKNPRLFEATHQVDSDVVIEWRALTVALVDRIAIAVRQLAGLDREALPLAKILEAGTWRAGRVLAQERRPGGAPPIRVDSDGTVF